MLQATGLAALASPWPRLATALPIHAGVTAVTHGRFRYDAVPAIAGRPAGLQVSEQTSAGLRPIQFLPAANVAAILPDSGCRHLYVAHSRAGETGEPSGYIRLYRIDPRTGLLALRVQRSLALSAQHPLAMALSPAAELLIVAAKGGSFSLLPVDAQGELQQVTAARKELVLHGLSHGDVWLRFLDESQLLVKSPQGMSAYHCSPEGMHPAERAV